jgi:hypothetical protein
MLRRFLPLSAFTYGYMRPDADTSAGGWTTASAGLYDAIDESVASDLDYIESPPNPSLEVCKIGLSNPSSTPTMPMIVRYRLAKSQDLGVVDFRVRLLQGTTEIAIWWEYNVTQAFVTYERALTSGEFSSITDFNDLYIEIAAIRV